MYARIMNNLFLMLLCFAVYSIQTVSFPHHAFSMYLISAIPAGGAVLNKSKQPKTDTDRIISEIRAQSSDGFFDLIFFVIRKGIKLALAFAIGWLMVPFLLFEVIGGIVGSIRLKQQRKQENQRLLRR
ncbi:hypothetical protein [Sporosarcina globispora]|uniref:hypothetical protein n=1 Tax=Sporosarcina globispora TaxID=1459 RepID=UPI000AE066CD|nr:hypothetical protein [Sporosarcina globispora]